MSTSLVCCGRKAHEAKKFSKPVDRPILRSSIAEMVANEVTVHSSGSDTIYNNTHLHRDDTPEIVRYVYEQEMDVATR